LIPYHEHKRGDVLPSWNRRKRQRSWRQADLDYEDREILLSARAYVLARVLAVRLVTAGGDTNGYPSNEG
jgi:hypothetical protein